MEHSEFLLTTAEIAVAFAGFASIVSVLGRERATSGYGMDARRLRIMLQASVTVVVFCLVPYAIHAFGTTQNAAIRISATLFLVWSIVGLVVELLRSRNVGQVSLPINPVVSSAVLLAELFIDVPLIVIVLGFMTDHYSALYLVALLATLVQSGIAFMRLVGSLLTGGDSSVDKADG